MLREEVVKSKPSDGIVARRTFSRSASWTGRSPYSQRPQTNSKPRSLLRPLEPLSINKRGVEEWPSAGSDDLGVWPLPQTPRGSIRAYDSNKDFQFKRDKLAFFDKECSRIAEHIYLGSETVAKNHELLRQKGITHVLNCVGFVCPEYFKSDFVYKTLWLQDSPSEDITSILYDVFDYFEDVKEQGGRVLVHCCQGVSRSTSLVIAYLMWRKGQSFEDAFQCVKSARGVTNPNMGFACQLLQCQKRVHAMPSSPNSMPMMYRMAPHSPYDPLHLVPKTVNQPRAQELDSRGAFIVHVPAAIYVWNGKHCDSVMSFNASAAAFQVIRYERVKGPILSIREGEEPSEFWIALSGTEGVKKEELVLPSEKESMEIADAVDMGIGPRKVDAYDLDFEIFHKALGREVVPPLSVSNAESETCLPAREHGWGRLRRRFASGAMKGLFTSSKWNCDATSCNDQNQHSVADSLSKSSNHPCGSPDSFDCSPSNNLDFSVPGVASSLPPSPPGTSKPFPCFLSSCPKFISKSPTGSPVRSDYTSSYTLSPSSTNCSDLSSMSSWQPSASGLESPEPFYVKDASFSAINSYLPLEKSSRSIAERRGSNQPPRMLLSLVNESSHVHKNLVRLQSSFLPDLDHNVMKDDCYKQFDHDKNEKWLISDAGIISSGVLPQSEINEKEDQNTVM